MNTSELHFNDVAIVGLGLIGGSIAKDIRAIHPGATIAAIDNNKESLAAAIAEGIIDREIAYSDIGRTANLVILASPLDVIQQSAQNVANALQEANQRQFRKYVVIDTASVKSPITRTFEALTKQSDTVEFLATHPMAGTEYSGFKHARKDLFRAKPWIITSHDHNSPEVITAVSGLIHELGAKVRQIDSETHDQQAGLVSHSVIVLSNILFDYIASNHPDALDLAGDGFISTTRLASGNPALHKSIVQNNAIYTLEHLREFSAFLGAKIDTIESQDDKTLLAYFTTNMNIRNRWLRRRK